MGQGFDTPVLEVTGIENEKDKNKRYKNVPWIHNVLVIKQIKWKTQSVWNIKIVMWIHSLAQFAHVNL